MVKNLGILRRARDYLDMNISLLVYMSLVLPRFTTLKRKTCKNVHGMGKYDWQEHKNTTYKSENKRSKSNKTSNSKRTEDKLFVEINSKKVCLESRLKDLKSSGLGDLRGQFVVFRWGEM